MINLAENIGVNSRRVVRAGNAVGESEGIC